MIKTASQLVSEVKPNIVEVTVDDLAEKLAQDIVLIDVREPGEYAEGHIAGAVNFPRGVLEMKLHLHPEFKDLEEPLEQLNKHQIYLVCRSGARSTLAAEALQRLGFDKVCSVTGGMMAWNEKGFHTE